MPRKQGGHLETLHRVKSSSWRRYREERSYRQNVIFVGKLIRFKNLAQQEYNDTWPVTIHEILNQLEKDKISRKRKRDESQIDHNQIFKCDEEVEENSDASAVSNHSKKKRNLAGHSQPITQFIKYKPGM